MPDWMMRGKNQRLEGRDEEEIPQRWSWPLQLCVTLDKENMTIELCSLTNVKKNSACVDSTTKREPGL